MIPKALFDAGLSTLFIPPYDHAASIVQPQPGTFGGQSTTVSVQRIRLERVLRSIPSHLSIVHLKTDCQAKDLQVCERDDACTRTAAWMSTAAARAGAAECRLPTATGAAD